MIEATETEYNTHISSLVSPTVTPKDEWCGWSLVIHEVSSIKEAIKSTHISGDIKYEIKNT